jgi:hypothetical protein
VVTDFDHWIENQFIASGPFTALIILVKIEGTKILPLGSSYATVIGSELHWPDMRNLLDRSKLPWNGTAIFPAFLDGGGPLGDGTARQNRVIADHAAINDGYFFDREGRMMRLEAIDA